MTQTATTGPPSAGTTSTGSGLKRRLQPALDAWAALTATLVILFAGLSGAGVLITGPLDESVGEWDLDVEQELVEERTDTLNTLSEMGTWFAETIPVLVLLLVAMAIAWRASRALAAPVFLAVVVGGEKLIYLIVSLVVARDRPPVPTLGDTYATNSFPSGHIASAITLYGGIALVIALQRSATVRRTLLVLVAVIGAVVGLCRMYRGFHYPTDVMAGTVLGVVWLVVVYVTVLVGRRSRPSR